MKNSDSSAPDSPQTFKGVSNAWLLKALFFETSTDENKERALYTLKPEDHTYKGKTYPSLRRLYLELGDESEYYFAEKYFGGWPHWKKLLNCNWFVDYLSEIREEFQVRQAAELRAKIRKIADDPNSRGHLSAAKTLLDETKTKSSVGRPTKESIRRKAEELFQDQSEMQDDLDRITAQMGSFTG